MTHRLLMIMMTMLFPAACFALDPDTTRKAVVVVELFTSEGCSSCPPADKVLSSLHDKADDRMQIITLAYHVDYWDRLGWKDRFSSDQWTQRQYRYATAFDSQQVYTPQMIVNGKHQFVGSRRDTAEKWIRIEAQTPVKTNLSIKTAMLKKDNGEHLQVSWTLDQLAENSELTVLLVEDQLQTDVRRGENTGRKLNHDGVVRHMVHLPLQDTQGKTLLPTQGVQKIANCRVVALVQNRRSMTIIGAAQASIIADNHITKSSINTTP